MSLDQRRPYQVLAVAAGINFLAGLLYIWSIVSKGLIEQYNWTSKQASLPYTIATISFVIAMAAAGRLQDKKGPRICAAISAILIGTGLILSSLTTNPKLILVTFGVITGAGIGFSSIATMPPALKWFSPQRKGLITGVVVGGIAIASVFYSPLMDYLIRQFGVSKSFLFIGVGVLVLMLVLSRFLTNPPAGFVPKPVATPMNKHLSFSQPVIETTWQETLHMPKFYVLWLMLGLSSAAGLMVIGHAAGIAKTQVGWKGGFILVILIAVFNALGRLVGGHISDIVGRIAYLRGVFIILAVNMLIFPHYQSIPLLCLGASITGVCYGSIFAVFPATTADYFGLKHFGANYGLVFTAWGFGGFLGPMTAASILDATGSYNLAYIIFSAILVVAFFLTLTFKAERQATQSAAVEA